MICVSVCIREFSPEEKTLSTILLQFPFTKFESDSPQTSHQAVDTILTVSESDSPQPSHQAVDTILTVSENSLRHNPTLSRATC